MPGPNGSRGIGSQRDVPPVPFVRLTEVPLGAVLELLNEPRSTEDSMSSVSTR